MKRGIVNGLGQGLHGDRTTTGAVCMSSLPQAVQSGQGVLRLGDKTTPCPKCGKSGVIVSSMPAMKWMGIPTALHGAVIHCDCPPGTNILVAPTERPGSASASVEHSPPNATPPPSTAHTSRPAKADPNDLREEEEEEEELEELDDTGIVLRLGLFFDGTGNNQANSAAAAGCHAADVDLTAAQAEDIRQRCAHYGFDGKGGTPDNSYGNAVSNVARLYELYPDQSKEHLSPEGEEAYIPIYLEGIGTSSGQGDSLYSQGTGQGDTGVVARVEQMPALVLRSLRRLRENNPGLKIRRIEIDLFGFSRGAAAARHCANDLLKGPGSLLACALPTGSPMLATGFGWRHRTDFGLNFIGLFDTVAGMVAPLSGDLSPHNARNPGLNLRLAPGIAGQVVQLVAGDEHRHNFSLTRTEHDIVMPGCHSDIGGGYLPLATEKLLLSRPDSSFSAEHIANEHSEAYRHARQRLEHSLDYWHAYIPPEGLGIETWAVQTLYRTRDTPPEKRVYAAVTGQRQVRGELSLVHLRIMRELAVHAGVAFDPIDPKDNRTALPAELEPIAAKLQAYALGESFTRLNTDELSLLRRHYIHHSANWNAAKGWNNSDLDVVFINRPAKDNVRTRHPNE